MGITERFNQMASSLKMGVKSSSTSLFTYLLKLFTCFVIGLTFTLIGQEMMGFGTISFVFMLVVAMGATSKLLAKWSFSAVVLFDLFCVLVALLLRMYILLAP